MEYKGKEYKLVENKPSNNNPYNLCDECVLFSECNINNMTNFDCTEDENWNKHWEEERNEDKNS